MNRVNLGLRGGLLLAAALVVGGVSGFSCGAAEDPEENGRKAVEESIAALSFTRVDSIAGIDFVHVNDASDERWLPETMGAGAAWADFDADGWPDLFLVNGTSLRGRDEAAAQSVAASQLYRNRGDGTFEDVTPGSGLSASLYGLGAAVGDFDHDGRIDLFVSTLGVDRLYRNLGGFRFADVTEAVGLDRVAGGFSSSAAFLDYDRDGDLDLFVGQYVAWSPETDLMCRPDGVHRVYCTPEQYPSVTNVLWRNGGEPSRFGFTEVSNSSGIASVAGKALGVLVFDHDADGWDDVLVANDTERNFLFHNLGDGTFAEIGVDAGVAYSESGAARGGMGIDGSDLDRDGYIDVVIGNFSYEMLAYYRGRDAGTYLDEAPRYGLGFPTLQTLAFGVRATDLTGDGWDDIVVVNGHIDPEIARLYPEQSYAQATQVFRNLGGSQFEEVTVLGDLEAPLVGRGLAVSDYDRDGDPDLLITQNGRPAHLFRNDGEGGATAGRRVAVRVQLIDRHGSPTPFGARVRLVAAGLPGGAVERTLRSGGSYLSADEPVLTLAWPPPEGAGAGLDSLLVRWPSGEWQAVETRDLRLSPGGVRELVVRQDVP